MTPEEAHRILAAEDLPGGFLRELPCAAHRPDRFAFAVDQAWVAKLFGPDDFRNFQIEEQVSSILHAQGIPVPEVIAAGSDEDAYSYLVFRHATGDVLNTVYQDLSLDEYTGMIACLAGVFRQIHGLANPMFSEVPFFERGHEQYFNLSCDRPTTVPNTVEALVEVGVLQERARQISDLVDSQGRELLGSEQSFIHADIHNENVFLDLTDGDFSCQFIDWETSRIEPLELDFVHPFLNILGEAFPGRRLGESIRGGSTNQLLAAFDMAYGRMIRWDHVAIHGVATFLDWALQAHRRKRFERRDFYLRTGIGGLEFVGLLKADELISPT